MSSKRARTRFRFILAGGGGGVGETSRDLVRACTPFIYSRRQVAHEIRLICGNGRGAVVYSVVSSVSREVTRLSSL